MIDLAAGVYFHFYNIYGRLMTDLCFESVGRVAIIYMGNTGTYKSHLAATKALHHAVHGFTKRLRQKIDQNILFLSEIYHEID